MADLGITKFPRPPKIVKAVNIDKNTSRCWFFLFKIGFMMSCMWKKLIWVCNKFPRSPKIVKIAKSIEFDRNTVSYWFLLDMTRFSCYHKRKYSKNRKNQKGSPLSGLSKSTRIILIAFFLIEKNAEYSQKLSNKFINRDSKVKTKIHKNHLKLQNIHSFPNIPLF